MRVIYLCEFPSLLGGERSLLTFLAEARNQGIDPAVVAPTSGPLAIALRDANVKHIAVRDPMKKAMEFIKAQIDPASVDIVHANSLAMADLAGQLADAWRVPAVVHVRDIYSLSAERWRRLSDAGAIIGVSGVVCAWLREHLPSSANVYHIVNAVDTTRFRPRPPRPLSSPARIGCIGQICLRKAQDVFLEAARIVAADRTDVRFLIVGERYSQKEESVAFERRLREAANRDPLAGKVEFLGYRDDVPDILQSLDVLVVSSRQEPLSRVMLEALAVGVPIVATDVGGNRELLDDERLGFLTDAGDAKGMAECIESSLGSESARQTAAIDGPNWIRDRFSSARQVEAIASIYRSLLADR